MWLNSYIPFLLSTEQWVCRYCITDITEFFTHSGIAYVLVRGFRPSFWGLSLALSGRKLAVLWLQPSCMECWISFNHFPTI